MEKSIDDELEDIGVDRREYIPQLHIETDRYIRQAQGGEPLGTATYKDEINDFKDSCKSFLEGLQNLPDCLAFFLFNSDQSSGAGDPKHAQRSTNWKNEIRELINNCETLARRLPPPEPHSQKKFWRRDWIMHVRFVLHCQNVIKPGRYWDFYSNQQWTDDAPYGRLAKVISILNKKVPKNLRVSRPKDLVYEMFGPGGSHVEPEKRPQK
jgi:hypothetical protein